MSDINKQENRRHKRLNSLINGNFITKSGEEGALIVTDLSQKGMKAAIDKRLPVGTKIKFAIIPIDTPMPIFGTGSIMWIRPKLKGKTFPFDVGIKSNMPNFINRQRMVEYCYKKWFLQRIAEYALQKGYFFNGFDKSFPQPVSLWPFLFLFYVIIGGVLSVFNKIFFNFYISSILSYFLWLLMHTRRRLRRTNQLKRYAIKTRLILSIAFGRMVAYLVYGLFFIMGMLRIKKPS
ncbi:MAG: PilZ domain-containing protein [Candidatus Omnitrophota bacterium]